MKNISFIIMLVGFLSLSACAQLPTDYNIEPSYVFSDTDNTSLGKNSLEKLKKYPGVSAMYLIIEGTDAFYARMALLATAERSIDVQYYIWHDDLIGKFLFKGIIEAADRGVRVRMLLDDLSLNRNTESIIYALDQHKNIEVRLFNPFASRGFHLADFITDASRMNRRMHNKSFKVDGQIIILGGRNIGNEYFAADEASNFKDIDVMSIGPIVKDVDKEFDSYWNSKVVFPVKAFEHNQAGAAELEQLKIELAEYTEAQHDSKYAQDVYNTDIYKETMSGTKKPNPVKLYYGTGNVIYDDPDKGTGKSGDEIVYLKSLMVPYLEAVKYSFELISPYFVPGDSGTKYLTELVKKGIKVRIVTNSLSSTDGIMAQSGYARHRIELLEGGVELYELKTEIKSKASRSLRLQDTAKSGLHAKTYIFDRKNIFIGSFNFDQRSANINTEVGVVYEIAEMAQYIAHSVFDEDISHFSYRVELEVKHATDEDGFDIESAEPVWIEVKDGKEIRHIKDPETSGWRRFTEDFFSVLPIESQL
jgi:putative cardiolipin synthase